jgi:hypothetical protein
MIFLQLHERFGLTGWLLVVVLEHQQDGHETSACSTHTKG